MRAIRLGVVALSAAACSCAADFTPGSVLNDLRVLAIVAAPLEAGPSDEVTVRAVTIPPPNAILLDQRWTFCPLSAGSSTAYSCAVPGCEVELPAPIGGSVTASPGALALQCLQRLSAEGGLPAGIPAQVPDQVLTLFRIVVTASNGETREAVQRVTLHAAGAPADRNVSPVITGVQIGSQAVATGDTAPPLSPGRQLEVRVLLDPASAQPYADAAGNTLRESLVVSFYTTAGRFDFDRASGPDASVNLKFEKIDAATTEAAVWAVARDLRGGEAVAGPFRVPLQR